MVITLDKCKHVKEDIYHKQPTSIVVSHSHAMNE